MNIAFTTRVLVGGFLFDVFCAARLFRPAGLAVVVGGGGVDA